MSRPELGLSTIAIHGSSLETGPPVRLFATRIFAGGVWNNFV